MYRGGWGLHRSIIQEGSYNPVVAQAGDECDFYRMSMRHRCDEPLHARATTSEPRMFVLVAVSSINTSRAGSRMPRGLVPESPDASDIGSFPLCRVQAFSQSSALCRSKKRWRALRLPGMPCFSHDGKNFARAVKSRCAWQAEPGSRPSALPMANTPAAPLSAPR